MTRYWKRSGQSISKYIHGRIYGMGISAVQRQGHWLWQPSTEEAYNEQEKERTIDEIAADLDEQQQRGVTPMVNESVDIKPCRFAVKRQMKYIKSVILGIQRYISLHVAIVPLSLRDALLTPLLKHGTPALIS